MNPFQFCRFFDGMRLRHIAMVIRCASEARYEPGTELFAEGESSKDFYLIKRGAVALEKRGAGGRIVGKILGAGDVLGRSWLEEPAWAFMARAVEETAATVLNGERLMACAEADPEFGLEFMKRVSANGIAKIESDGEVIPSSVERRRPAAHAGRGRTETSTTAPRYSTDTMDISLTVAEQLAIRDGQWVQISDQSGSTILPVRIKAAGGDQGKKPRITQRQAPDSPMEGVVSLVRL